jgi:hypothetical protein
MKISLMCDQKTNRICISNVNNAYDLPPKIVNIDQCKENVAEKVECNVK